jgi:phosphate transport system substrate-binding protein
LRDFKEVAGGFFIVPAPVLVTTDCTAKALPLSYSESGKFVSPYQEPVISASDCSDHKRNKLNLQAAQNQQYPGAAGDYLHTLYVVIRKDGIGRDAGIAYANLLLSDEGQALLETAGYLRLQR